GVTYSFPHDKDLSDERQLRFGGRYSLGLVNVSAGFDENDWSLGVFSSLFSLHLGFMYESSKITDVLGEKVVNDTFWAELTFLF
ncbi:MAG: hypothetical protein KDD22_07675, partial [Bdellovibrionales bacterium]|nr:hypothetical protein [Bdellovibrionales bacterium]